MISAEALEHRGKSYDAAALYTGEIAAPEFPYDAILWARPLSHGLPLERVLEASTGLMCEGGRVLITFEENELADLVGDLTFSGLNKLLLPLGYKLLVWRRSSDDADFHLITACQFSCSADEVLAMLYQEFPVNGITTDPGIRFNDGPAPDSPPTECP